MGIKNLLKRTLLWTLGALACWGQAASPNTLSGTVKNTAGAPLAGLEIRLEPGDRSVLSGANGDFQFPTVTSGNYILTVTGRGYIPQQRATSVPGPGIELKMETVQSTIEVRADDDSFLANTSISITKSPEALLSIPYAIQVIPRAVLEDRAIQDVKDLYRNISGVTDSPYSAVTFRGFTQRETLFNGVRGNPYGSLENDINDAGFSTSQGRLTNVEFVEVLKGPAAVLYGAGEPGGVINFVTKKPRTEHSMEASFRGGNFQQLGGHVETTGPLSRSRNLFYRAAWYQEDRDTFRNNSSNENKHAAAAASWRIGEATSFGAEYEYIDQLLPGYRLRGIPVNAAGANLTNREWSAAEPTDFSALQGRVAQMRLDHAFTSTLRTDVTFRYLNYDRPERYHEPRGINANGTMRREFRDQYRANDDWSLTANGYQRWNGAGRHNLTFGFETVRQDWTGRYGTAREQERGGPVPAINITNPVYGLTNGSLYPISAFTLQSVDSKRTGGFVQDQIDLLPRLQLMLGGRLERFEDNGTAAQPLRFNRTALTGRVGLVYRVRSNVTAFASYGNAFTRPPALAQTATANGPHDPELSRQFEVGAKAEWRRVLVNASAFRITKRNVLRPDPAFGPTGANFSAVLPIGRVRNQGLEFDATGRITRDVSVIFNYAFLDSEIVSDRFTPSAVGQPMPNAARHAFGAFLRYDLRKTGTGITIGNESRGRRYEPYAGIQAAGYGIWDVGLFQRLHRNLELRLQLDNVTDKTYALSSLFAARAGNMPGAPRTITASIYFRSRGQ